LLDIFERAETRRRASARGTLTVSSPPIVTIGAA
jgi:hypothetical protein